MLEEIVFVLMGLGVKTCMWH